MRAQVEFICGKKLYVPTYKNVFIQKFIIT